jgi:hypothetical protein
MSGSLFDNPIDNWFYSGQNESGQDSSLNQFDNQFGGQNIPYDPGNIGENDDDIDVGNAQDENNAGSFWDEFLGGGSPTGQLGTVSPNQTAPAQGLGTGLYGQGIPASIASGSNVIGGAIGNAISAGFTSLANAWGSVVGAFEQTAASWAIRGAFFLVGLVIFFIGLHSLVDPDNKAGAYIAKQVIEE